MSRLPGMLLSLSLLLTSPLKAEIWFPGCPAPAAVPPYLPPVPPPVVPVVPALPTPAPYIPPVATWAPTATPAATPPLLSTPTPSATPYLAPPIATPAPMQPACGNGICEWNEGPALCSRDCAPPTPMATPTPGPVMDEYGCIPAADERDARVQLRNAITLRPVTKQAYQDVLAGRDPGDDGAAKVFRSSKLGQLGNFNLAVCRMKLAKQAGITHVISLMGTSPQGGQESRVNDDERRAAALAGVTFVEVNEMINLDDEDIAIEAGWEEGGPAIAEIPAYKPDGLHVPAFGRTNDDLNEVVEMRTSAFLAKMGELSGSKVLFHCWHGKDRTGYAAGLYLYKNGGLDAPAQGTLAEEIYKKYMLGYTAGGQTFDSSYKTLTWGWEHFTEYAP